MFKQRLSQPHHHAEKQAGLSLFHRLPTPFAPWFLALSITLLATLTIWFIAQSDRLSAATKAQITPPLTIDGNRFGLGALGATRTYTHTVTNNGPIPRTVTLTVESLRGWSVSVHPTSVTLGSGISATAVVTMTIPNNAPPGIVDVATLTAQAGVIKATAKDSLLVETNTALAIPELELGQLVNGRRVYSLSANSTTTQFRPGMTTPTWGYNDNTYLGPTLVVTKTEDVEIQVTNNLTEVTTVHWHGLHLPGKTDGGPHQEIAVGETWKPNFTIINEAETAWYHPHPHPHGHGGGSAAETAIQVYRGLAGMMIVRDANSTALNIPQTYGVDDFPVVVQDRKFKSNGTFDESVDDVGIRAGDQFLVNGTFGGVLEAPAQMVRFRVLNGANHRFFNFGISDGRNFYQIASDNGLLNAPVQRNRFHMGPGERIEIVVDLSNAQGQTLHFVAYDAELGDTLVPEYIADDFDRSNFILFSINVNAPTAGAVTSLPSTLNSITRYNPSNAVRIKTLNLTLPPTINGVAFDIETVNITTTLGTQEIWSIVNLSNDPHPFHIHDSPFQVIKHFDILGREIPIPAHELGWKDTIIVRAGERVDVIKDFSGFDDPTGP
jgi:FtsP/CotA-like multicopper oxidase with cupredoxin domain